MGELSELELLQRSLYQKEFDNLRHKSTWLDSMKQLPFDCTGCGNCCKTTGNVYMSPEEVSSAASYKNMTTSEFIDLYADYRLETTSASTIASKALAAGGGEVPWILLQNREPPAKKKHDHVEGQQQQQPAACVFLDRETNQCGIYSVRPIQCSTYPFWSNILESEQNWNDEVRRKDGNNEKATTVSSDQQHLPAWTPDGGGCEGMKKLHAIDIKVDNDVDVEATADESEGVPVNRALQQLSLYKRADRRLPRSYNKIRLQQND
jgi:Fe-S-cluster containining protein